MTTLQAPTRLTDEIAELFASCPSRDELLGFRPSDAVVERVRALLDKLKEGELAEEERRELDHYEQAELLMRLVKARLRTKGNHE